MLREMERSVGLSELSQTEQDVFQAAHEVSATIGAAIRSDQIRNHPLVAGIAQATYHRTLNSLLDMGLLELQQGCKAKHYVVCKTCRPD